MNNRRVCPGPEVGRRDFLYAGWLAGAGLTLGQMLKLEASEERGPAGSGIAARAKSVIHIYLQGGFAHMDSFDPKPDAPLEYRGILDPISTSVSGMQFSSHSVRLRRWRIG
jgi:hypothetical protein